MSINKKDLTFQNNEIKKFVELLLKYNEKNKLYINKEFIDKYFEDISSIRYKIRNVNYKNVSLNISKDVMNQISQVEISKIVEFDPNLSKKDYDSIPFDKIIFELNRVLNYKKSAKRIIDETKDSIISFPNEVINASKNIKEIVLNEKSNNDIIQVELFDQSIVYKEILEIIASFNDNDYYKIPIEYIDFLIENQSNSLNFKYDINKSLDEQNVSIQTRCFLLAIFKDYIANEKQKSIIESNINYSLELLSNTNNINEMKNEISKVDNNGEVRNALEEVLSDYVEDENCTSLMVCEEENFLRRIFDKFKKFILKFKTDINEI